jgi:hypothetical protein
LAETEIDPVFVHDVKKCLNYRSRIEDQKAELNFLLEVLVKYREHLKQAPMEIRPTRSIAIAKNIIIHIEISLARATLEEHRWFRKEIVCRGGKDEFHEHELTPEHRDQRVDLSEGEDGDVSALSV